MANSISAASLLSSSLATQSAYTQATVAVLKKSNDVAKQEGAALVQLLEDSLPQTSDRLLDTYA